MVDVLYFESCQQFDDEERFYRNNASRTYRLEFYQEPTTLAAALVAQRSFAANVNANNLQH
jgi:hypothetical protein